MPELPEVETVRRGLETRAVGQRVEAVEVLGRRSVRRTGAKQLIDELTGRRLEVADRHGKYLLVDLDDGAVLAIHLRMSGQLLYLPPGAERRRHTHVVLRLESGDELHFVDQRTFGELFVTNRPAPGELPTELGALGPDALDTRLDRRRLAAIFGRRRTSVKAVLLDQRAIAGVGNIYADEICFRSRLLPGRPADSLSPAELSALGRALRAVLREAVDLGGSSLVDAGYRDLFGELGSFQERHFVYGRAGEPCRRCGTPIERIRIAGRSAHFCPHCQR